MQISLFAEHISLSPRQEAYVERKVLHLQHFASRVGDEATRVRVEFRREDLKTTQSRIECFVTVALPGKRTLRAEEWGKTVEEAIDLVVSKLRKQVERYKTVVLLRRKKLKQRFSPRRL